MELHVKLRNKNETNGVSAGDLEIWSDNCESDAERALALLLTTNLQNTMTLLTNMSSALFEKPSDER